MSGNHDSLIDNGVAIVVEDNQICNAEAATGKNQGAGILDRGVDATLTLIGSGPDEEALREAARDLTADGMLLIEPPIPNEVLRKRLRDFHVYVLNSEFEGMPQALLEAMSQGCVPVVTDVSSGTVLLAPEIG